jgi:hypothetical protein
MESHLLKHLAPFVWPALALAAAVLLRRQIFTVLDLLIRRLGEGGALSLGPLKLSEVKVMVGPNRVVVRSQNVEAQDDNGIGAQRKEALYKSNRYVFLTHRLYRSLTPGQAFDVLLYLIPRTTADAPLDALAHVKEVRYFLGRYWGNKIIIATNRWDNFAIAISAWGNTACLAEIVFNDGETVTQWRYIDFEMAYLAGLGSSARIER